MAIFFTAYGLKVHMICPVSSLSEGEKFFLKEPSSDSTSQGENGVVAYSNSNTGDICAYFKKRNVSDERKYSLVVSLRTPDQEKLEHRWSCRKKFNRNSVIIQEITRNQNKRSHTDRQFRTSVHHNSHTNRFFNCAHFLSLEER